MSGDPILCVHGMRKTYLAEPARVRASGGSELDVAISALGLRQDLAPQHDRRRGAGPGSHSPRRQRFGRRPELVSSHDSPGARRLRLPATPPVHGPTTDHPTEPDPVMAAVLYRLKAALRTDWRSLVVVTLLVALAGGAVLSAVSAASRTASAYAGMRQATDAWDVLVTQMTARRARSRWPRSAAFPAWRPWDGRTAWSCTRRSSGRLRRLSPCRPSSWPPTGTAGYRVGRPLMVSGRQPAPGDPNGVWVERTFALAHHLHVGQTFTFTIITQQLLDDAMNQGSEAQGLAMIAHAPAELRGRLRIDGIGVTTDDVVVDPGYQPGSFELTPAFRAAHPHLLIPYWGAMVKLAPGTSMNAFTARVRALDPNESIAFQRALPP